MSFFKKLFANSEQTVLNKKSLQPKDNSLELYYHYLVKINELYKNRGNANSLKQCIELCKKSINIFPNFKNEYIKRNNVWDVKSVPCFNTLAIIYEKQGKYKQAINICKQAMSYGLNDGTKAGYKGRIIKLERKTDG